MKVISRDEAVERINALRANSHYFRVKFEKRTTGEIREMNCQFNVKKHLQGGTLKFDPSKKSLIGPVYDVNGGEDKGRANVGYKFIPVEGLQEVTIEGETFKVE